MTCRTPTDTAIYAVGDTHGRVDLLAALRERFAAALPQVHLDFFRALPTRHLVGGYRFVHGGARPGVALMEQTDHDCM